MKKYYVLALNLCFYLASLLFVEPYIAIIVLILLISYLFLENKWLSFIPLIFVFYLPKVYIILLIASWLYHILLYPFMKKNRYYCLGLVLVAMIMVNTVLIMLNDYHLETLYVSLISYIIYSVIQLFFIFYQKNNKRLIISFNDKLIFLTLLLGYLLLGFYCELSFIFFLFLFIQLFVIFDLKYVISFFAIYFFIYYVMYQEFTLKNLSLIVSSVIPPFVIISFDFTQIISIFYVLYTLVITATYFLRNKRITENNYISELFKDFKSYIDDLNIEYDRLKSLKAIKENHIEYLYTNFCEKCQENKICQKKPDKRYSFITSAINGLGFNLYACPHYEEFSFDYPIDVKTNYTQYSAISVLANELEYLYHQNIKLAKSYNKFINEIMFYGYSIQNINVNLATPTIYFTLTLNNTKPIVNEIFLKIAHKAFNETLEIKTILDDKANKICIYKKPKVKLDYSHMVLPKDSNIISGDNYYIKKDYNDSYMFAISDGMGSGHNAYIQSAEALKIISNLSKYHFSISTILRLLEDIYELRSEYETYATLDLLYLNTANMKLNLYKLGSTTTYIYHADELTAYENKALPLKLDDINSTYEIEYFVNDVILLFSDGVSDFISPLALKNEIDYQKDSKSILQEIIHKIKTNAKNNLKDDASIIVIKIV